MFFVMLNHPSENIEALIMTQGTYDEPAFFATQEDARKAAKNNTLGENFGYEIFELGTGES